MQRIRSCSFYARLSVSCTGQQLSQHLSHPFSIFSSSFYATFIYLFLSIALVTISIFLFLMFSAFFSFVCSFCLTRYLSLSLSASWPIPLTVCLSRVSSLSLVLSLSFSLSQPSHLSQFSGEWHGAIKNKHQEIGEIRFREKKIFLASFENFFFLQDAKISQFKFFEIKIFV